MLRTAAMLLHGSGATARLFGTKATTCGLALQIHPASNSLSIGSSDKTMQIHELQDILQELMQALLEQNSAQSKLAHHYLHFQQEQNDHIVPRRHMMTSVWPGERPNTVVSQLLSHEHLGHHAHGHEHHLTVQEALLQAIDEEMERDDRVFVLGEEVGQNQGIHKVTKDLGRKYGEGRVLDTPISEMGFTGLAVGSAMAGLRPICEFMTWNFAMQSIDHILNSAAKMYYMSAGKISVPIVFRGPNGFEAGMGAQHCQDYGAWFAHCPGLKVAAPFSAEDAKGLLKAAIRDDNPVVFLEHTHLYEAHFAVGEDRRVLDDPEFMVPLGEAKVEREGTDVTMVSYSIGVGLALKSACELDQQHGVSAEVINLRSLRPIDFDCIKRSVLKTRRLVTVETGWPICGIGAEISAHVFESDFFDHLLAPVLRVTGADVPMPYAKTLETRALPSTHDVIHAVQRMFRLRMPSPVSNETHEDTMKS